jgi:hypothetical protein
LRVRVIFEHLFKKKYKQGEIIQMLDFLLSKTYLSSLLDECFNRRLVFRWVQIVLHYSFYVFMFLCFYYSYLQKIWHVNIFLFVWCQIFVSLTFFTGQKSIRTVNLFCGVDGVDVPDPILVKDSSNGDLQGRNIT